MRIGEAACGTPVLKSGADAVYLTSQREVIGKDLDHPVCVKEQRVADLAIPSLAFD